MPGIYLSETTSSLVHMVLVLAIGMVVPQVLSRTNGWHRALLFGVAGVLTVRYVWWRATETSLRVGPSSP